jgi:MarR family 2-MHQ and catechol resistance regulon transcriptional repressor
MTDTKSLLRLDEVLNRLAALYQFRSLEEPLYDTLTVSQSYCLRSLYFCGSQTMSALAEKLHVQLSTMTGVVDQLEAKKLVERLAHPSDRRSLQVKLTSKGRKIYRAAHEAFLSNLQPLFRDRPPADREKILSFLEEVIQAVHGWREHPYRKVRKNGKKSS